MRHAAGISSAELRASYLLSPLKKGRGQKPHSAAPCWYFPRGRDPIGQCQASHAGGAGPVPVHSLREPET